MRSLELGIWDVGFSMPPIVRLTHLDKYFGRLHVLKDIALEVQPQEVVRSDAEFGARDLGCGIFHAADCPPDAPRQILWPPARPQGHRAGSPAAGSRPIGCGVWSSGFGMWDFPCRRLSA